MPGFLSRSGSVGRARWVAGCAVAWAAAAASAPAQTVQGTIQDAEGLPVSGALVSLETPAGDPSVSTVSGSSGAYRVTAAGAGPYRLRVQRIGFADAVTEAFDVPPGETVVRGLTVTTAPVILAPLDVRATGECDVRPEEGRAAWTLWREASKVLAITAWSEERDDVRYRARLYRQVVDAWGQPQGPRVETEVFLYGEHPFHAAPSEELAERGYLWTGEEAGLYGPDPWVLLSESFHDTHCFRARPGPGRNGRVGLEFEPLAKRDIVDVEGTLWLDSASSELRVLEFTYTNLPDDVARRGLAGQLEFRRLETGHWVVSRWWVRGPIYHPQARNRYRHLMEDGGVIESVEILPRRVEPPVAGVEPAPDLLRGVGGAEGARPPPEIDEALSLYRDLPDSALVADLLEGCPEFAAEPAAASRIARARLWTRAGEPELALETLAGLSDEHPLAGIMALERARALFALELVPEAAAEFWSACARVGGELRDEIWLDLRSLATPDEQRTWESLPARPSTCAWLRGFIAERARLRGVSDAERLAEHYARLRHARDHYWLPRPRETPGYSDRSGRPPDLEFDDRGLVYVRLGEPDDWVFWTPADICMPSTETWRYVLPDGPRFYHFSPASPAFDPGSLGGACAPPPVADYRLHGSLAASLGIRQRWVLRQEGRAVFFGPRIAPDLLSELYLTRAGLDPWFATRAYRFRTQSLGRVMADLEAELVNGLAGVRDLLEGARDVPAVRPRVRLRWEILRFRGASPGLWQVWALASARAGDLRSLPTDDGVSYSIDAAIALTAAGRTDRHGSRFEVTRSDEPAASDGISIRLPLSLQPGVYPFTLLVADANTSEPVDGNWDTGEIRLPEFDLPLPAVSDIAVAADSGGAWTPDGEVYLKASPAHATGPDGTLHVYFEVYGIEPATGYKVDVRIVPEAAADRMYDLEPSDLAFGLLYGSRTPADRPAVGRHHLRIDLGDTEAGAYLLGVRVTDAGAGVASLPVTTPVVRP